MFGNKPPRSPVALYARVSSEDQADAGTIENQIDVYQQWIKIHGVESGGIFADDGVSGTVPFAERIGGRSLLDALAMQQFTDVAVRRIDRIGSDAKVILDCVDEAEKRRGRIHSIMEAFDMHEPAGRYMLTMFAGFAGYRRDTIVANAVNGIVRRAKAGDWLGSIEPFGYRIVRENDNGKKFRRLVPADELIPGLPTSEADIVRMMYQTLADGKENASCTALAKILNELKVPTVFTRTNRSRGNGAKASGVWEPPRIRNIIVQPLYRGTHVWNMKQRDGTVIGHDRETTPLVSPEVWDAAQARLKHNQGFSMRNAKRKYLLRGLIKCGLCGLAFTGGNNGDGKYIHYTCAGKMYGRGIYGKMGTKCPSRSIGGIPLEDAVWDTCAAFLAAPNAALAALYARLATNTRPGSGDAPEGHRDALKYHLQNLTGDLESKRGERNAMLNLFRQSMIDMDALRTQLAEIDAEEDNLRERITQLNRELDGENKAAVETQKRILRIEEVAAEIAASTGKLSWETKRKVVEALVVSIVAETTPGDGVHPRSGRTRAIVTLAFDEND